MKEILYAVAKRRKVYLFRQNIRLRDRITFAPYVMLWVK